MLLDLIKHFRAIATRNEKLAIDCRGFLMLVAVINLYFEDLHAGFLIDGRPGAVNPFAPVG